MEKKKKKIDMRIFIKRSLLSVLIAYLCFLFISQQFSFMRLSKEEKILDKQTASEQRKNEELTEQKEASGTPESIERVAREKLGYLRPDEKVFIDAKKQ